MNKEKIILLFIFVFMTVGFRVPYKSYRWDISENDPYLWIKPCDRQITIHNDLASQDPLSGDGLKNNLEGLSSIADDVNHIFASYVRLELYPENPNSPPADSHFTIEKSIERTITICSGNPADLAGGQSKREFKGKKVIGCEIIYDPTVHQSLKDYLAMIGHELGHCLGLDHPQDISDSLMSYYSNPDKTYRLAPDDKLGIRYLYPANVPGVSHKEEATYGLSCAYKK